MLSNGFLIINKCNPLKLYNDIFEMQELCIFCFSTDIMESYTPKSFTFMYSMHAIMVNFYLKASASLNKTSKVEQVIPKCHIWKKKPAHWHIMHKQRNMSQEHVGVISFLSHNFASKWLKFASLSWIQNSWLRD